MGILSDISIIIGKYITKCYGIINKFARIYP
jgi:hypothetical protein